MPSHNIIIIIIMNVYYIMYIQYAWVEKPPSESAPQDTKSEFSMKTQKELYVKEKQKKRWTRENFCFINIMPLAAII